MKATKQGCRAVLVRAKSEIATVLALVLLCSSPCWATIAFVQDAFGGSNSATTSAATFAGNVTVGNDVVVVVSVFSSSITVTGISDTHNTYVHQVSATNASGGGIQHVEIWTAHAVATGGLLAVTVTYSGTITGLVEEILGEYSGVQAIGTNTTNVSNTGTTNPTISLATQDANNFVVGGHAIFAGPTATVQTGNLRHQSALGNSNTTLTFMDNTSASPASTTISVTIGATAREWSAAAVELRTSSGGGGTARHRGYVVQY